MNRWDVGEVGWQLLPGSWKQWLSTLAAICIVGGFWAAPDLSQHLLQRASDSYVRYKVQPSLDRLQQPPSTLTSVVPRATPTPPATP